MAEAPTHEARITRWDADRATNHTWEIVLRPTVVDGRISSRAQEIYVRITVHQDSVAGHPPNDPMNEAFILREVRARLGQAAGGSWSLRGSNAIHHPPAAESD